MDKVLVAVERGYRVSKEGVCYNNKGNSVGYDCKRSGYSFLKLKIDKKPINVRIHRIQAYQKYGDKLFEQGIVVRHKDRDGFNNSWDNILIGTASENRMDVPKGIRKRSAMIATSFVRKYDRNVVKEFYSKTKSYKKTMEKFNISSKGTLHFILNGRK